MGGEDDSKMKRDSMMTMREITEGARGDKKRRLKWVVVDGWGGAKAGFQSREENLKKKILCVFVYIIVRMIFLRNFYIFPK